MAPPIAEQRQHIKAQIYEGKEGDLDVFVNGEWVTFEDEETALRVKFHNETDPNRKAALLEKRKQLRQKRK